MKFTFTTIPFTKEGPILLKAKRAGYTVKLKLTKKFTKLVNDLVASGWSIYCNV